MKIRGLHPILIVPLASLCGCANLLSGLGGSEQLACKAPPGVACASVSAVYAAPSAQTRTPATLPPALLPPAQLYALKRPNTDSGTPAERQVLRSSPRVLRLWIAPWEDADGDLVEATRVHVLVDQGRWLVDTARAIAPAIELGVTPPSGDVQPARSQNEASDSRPATTPDIPFPSTRQP